MNTNLLNKCPKTLARIESIQTDLKYHLNNINHLKSSFNFHLRLKKFTYMPRIIKYSTLPRNENVFRYTLRNLTDQVALLKRELNTLIEYGR